MTLDLTIFADDKRSEEILEAEIKRALKDVHDVRVRPSTDGELGQVIFVQPSPKARAYLTGLAGSEKRRGRAVFLVVTEDEATEIPEELEDGLVDDVIVHPLRKLEVISKIRLYEQLLMWNEVEKMNASFSELMGQLKEDFKLAERLQKSNLPARFPDVRGFKISQRYLAGMKSGGDHFDLGDSKDGGQLSVVLTDSSSYGLSSAVLSTLMRVTMKLSVEEVRSSSETVRRIQEELKATLTEKDKLSLFYGVLSRKDYRLRYVNLGSSMAFYAPVGGQFTELKSGGGAITSHGTLTSGELSLPESEVTLEPSGRLALISDGFAEVIGGNDQVRELLNEFRSKDAKDALNEMVFRVKKQFVEDDDMPAQDCTGVIFDLDARLIRLA
jgi:serine phosphatase RsbU (regulator of sigma subunit)